MRKIFKKSFLLTLASFICVSLFNLNVLAQENPNEVMPVVDDVLTYQEVYLQDSEGSFDRWKHGQYTWATPDETVVFDITYYDQTDPFNDGKLIGEYWIFDENNPNNKLSGIAKELTKQNPLKVYYKLPYTVSYEYEGDVPVNAPTLPSTVYAGPTDNITIAEKPTVDGYTFTGWEVKSGNATINNDSVLISDSSVVLSGKWEKVEEEVTWWYSVSTHSSQDKNSEMLIRMKKAGKALSSETVNIDTDFVFNDLKQEWGSLEFNGGILGEQYIFEFDNPNNRLSATAGEATHDNPLKLYLKRAPHMVTYKMTGDLPDGVNAETIVDTWWSQDLQLLDVDAVDGYTFKGWELKSPTNLDIKDNQFTVGNEDIVFEGVWEKVEVIIPTPTPSTPETNKEDKPSSNWDDGGPFTRDECGNVFDRWGNELWHNDGCDVISNSGYNLVNTADK